MITTMEYNNMMDMLDFMKKNNYDAARFQQDNIVLNHYADAAIVPFIESALKTRKNMNFVKEMGMKMEEVVTDTYIVFMRRLNTVLKKQEVTIGYLQLMINNIMLDMYKKYITHKKEFTMKEDFWHFIADRTYCMEDMADQDTELMEQLQVVYKKAAYFKKVNAIAFFGVTVLHIPASLLSEAVNHKGVDQVYKFVISVVAEEYKYFPLSFFGENLKAETTADRIFTAKDLHNYNRYCLKVLKKELENTYDAK